MSLERPPLSIVARLLEWLRRDDRAGRWDPLRFFCVAIALSLTPSGSLHGRRRFRCRRRGGLRFLPAGLRQLVVDRLHPRLALPAQFLDAREVLAVAGLFHGPGQGEAPLTVLFQGARP